MCQRIIHLTVKPRLVIRHLILMKIANRGNCVPLKDLSPIENLRPTEKCHTEKICSLNWRFPTNGTTPYMHIAMSSGTNDKPRINCQRIIHLTVKPRFVKRHLMLMKITNKFVIIRIITNILSSLYSKY